MRTPKSRKIFPTRICAVWRRKVGVKRRNSWSPDISGWCELVPVRSFLIGGDSEDLTQEGMVGLIKAVREYDAEKEASFRTFAEICIRSRLYSVLRAAGRGKHSPLNQSVL